MITYQYAANTEGNIVDINDVTIYNREKHYYCIGCGSEMSAVLGRREHHFRHKQTHCSWESYLHKLGKRLLKERFYSRKDFTISYYAEYVCDKFKQNANCRYKEMNCYRRELRTFNLKDFFDTCEEEVTYNGYRADLMLSSKEHPERKPVFIELSVTHDCDANKLASGIRIIELKICEEKDVMYPLVEDRAFFNHQLSQQSNHIGSLPSIRFYNFKRRFEAQRGLSMFWIAKDDRGMLRGHCKNELNCHDSSIHREDSLYELTTLNNIDKGKLKSLYLLGIAKSIIAGFDVSVCDMCEKYRRCKLYEDRIEENYKTGEKRIIRKIYQTCKLEGFDKVYKANICEMYLPNWSYIHKIIEHGRALDYWEWAKSE